MTLREGIVRILQPVARRFPKAALLFQLYRESRSVFLEPKETTLGFKFCGNEIMEQGQFEIEETEIVGTCLKHAELFVNIGANIGYYCCLALQEGKRVIAFEPIDANLVLLYKNIQANNWDDRIEVFPIALGRSSGLIEIYGSGTSASLIKGWAGAPEYKKKPVPLSTLDTVFQNRFSGKQCFVLVDIEGAEDYMLEGASLFLDMTPKPIWMIEIVTTEHMPKGVNINPRLLSTFDKFWNNGYEAWTADSRRRLISRDEIRRVADGGANSLATHNFLFIEKGRKNEIMGS